ncbi:carbohydrate-binding protein [Kitasatospora sp. NPDC048365]|uniref:carbohydrate-binding protein n=1 Tax=Kitasatospora sp. NPDC048365 TaxID=3364050 RepID=UPI00371E311E
MSPLNRRTFLVGGVAAATGLAAGVWAEQSAEASPIGSGWTEVSGDYTVHQPSGLTRHTVDGSGLHHFWLNDTDPVLWPTSSSGPRSEIRFLDEYSSGSAQFEADVKVGSGAHRVCVMQIFGATTSATTFMALAMNTDSLNYYDSATQLHSPVYDRWVHLNVVHDTAAAKVFVYVNGQLRKTFNDRGAGTHYFKCGIYGREGMSQRSDVYVDNIHLYRKSGGSTPSPSPTATSSVSATPTASPTATATSAAAWVAGRSYAVGDRAAYGGLVYRCLQAHTSQAGWEPPSTPALWQLT